MHDIVFAGKIISLLKEKVGREGNYKNIAVNVALGPFTHVTRESLAGAFDLLKAKEGFQNVALHITTVKAAIKCRKCGVTTKITKPTVACPECGCADFELENPEEFIIESMEIE
jgi:hydrogenase nickel incorporation protein HypA/HybF